MNSSTFPNRRSVLSGGLGAVAAEWLLQRDLLGATADPNPLAAKAPHFAPRA